MADIKTIGATLAAWRDAEQRLSTADDAEAESLASEAARRHEELQRLSAEHMAELIAKLDQRDALTRR